MADRTDREKVQTAQQGAMIARVLLSGAGLVAIMVLSHLAG